MTHPLEELADRVEKLTGPCVTTDLLIWIALGREHIAPAPRFTAQTKATAYLLVEIARKDDALRAFAEACDQIKEDEPDDEWAKFRHTVGDYRRAKAALGERKND